uniref:Repulsive guidance molecule C-terminal domain-containing protein n=1 Tax=Romanomermis culicivorax TaxID=13658 RepID=A0A915KDU4_ROMCU
MPEEALAQESFMSPWQLCLSSCSPGEKVNYTEALKNPTRYFESLADKQLSFNGRPSSFMARDVAAAVCRAAHLADFFFDACVFDLMVSGGDVSYRDAARDALDDIRSMYPVYGRHYETNRSDLKPYLATAAIAIFKVTVALSMNVYV